MGMEKRMKNKRISYFVFSAIMAMLLLFVIVEGTSVYKSFYKLHRQEAQRMLDIYSENMQLKMNDSLNHADYLARLALLMGDEDTTWFDEAAGELVDKESVCFALLIRQNDVIRAVPESVKADYEGKSINDFSYVYSMAKVVEKLVVDGPVCVQVGEETKDVFLYLQPYWRNGKYAGEVVAAIDSACALEELELSYFEGLGYDYELWRVEPQAGRKEIIAVSNDTLDFSEAIKTKIVLPTEWTISIIPREGWIIPAQKVRIIGICILAFVILLLFVLSVYRLVRTQRFLHNLSGTDIISKMPNKKGLTAELEKWQKRKAAFTLIYFVYEGYNKYAQQMNEKEEEQFLRDIPLTIQEYLHEQYICARVGEGNFILAIGKELSQQELGDLAKDISIELMLKVGEGKRRIFLTPRYQYGLCTPQDTVSEVIQTIVKEYGKKYYEESPLQRMAETCRRLTSGEANVTFEEYADQQMMELSKAFNQYSKKVEQLAYTDPVFHVGNRLKFLRDTNMLICYDRNRSFSLFCIDICKFNQYNELFNTKVGDEILEEMILRLDRVYGSYFYRINGDVFVGILLTEEPQDMAAERIRKIIEEPVTIENVTFDVRSRIAACTYPEVGETPQELMDRLQSAMQYAKARNKITVLYNEQLKAELETEADILLRLKKAIEEDSLEVWYQPIHSIKRGRTVAVESLMRLTDKTGKFFPAGKVAELAEQSGLAERMGDYILRRACEFMKENEEKLGLDYITVNISVQQLMTTKSSEHFLKSIRKTQVNPRKIVLEITESMLMQSLDVAYHILNELREAGIRIALDDFGVGFSSLNYLSNLPVDFIKIDRLLTQQIIDSKRQRMLVKAILEMAQINDLCLIVEGIETQEELDLIVDIGVDHIQGYYFSKPLSEGSLKKYLTKQKV